MSFFEPGTRVELMPYASKKHRGTVLGDCPGSNLVNVRWDAPFNGRIERPMPFFDLRPLSLLELIAEAAQ